MLSAIDASLRAERAKVKIDRKPSTVTFTRPKVVSKTGTTPEDPLPAQVVRVNSDNRATVIGGAAGVAPKLAVMVYGVVGHPDPAVPDSDIRVGYTFPFNGQIYSVVNIIPNTPGEVQAQATTLGGTANVQRE